MKVSMTEQENMTFKYRWLHRQVLLCRQNLYPQHT